jgi:hypothetical protein
VLIVKCALVWLFVWLCCSASGRSVVVPTAPVIGASKKKGDSRNGDLGLVTGSTRHGFCSGR